MKKIFLAGLMASLMVSQAGALRLPEVNCSSASDARCKSGQAGTVGSGVPFNLGGFVFFGSGFVDSADNAVYLPVEFGSQQDALGVIFKVDLATGNRTVVSGNDGEEWRGKGVDYVNDRGQRATAYDLGRVSVVRPGPAGKLLALVDKGLQSRTEIIMIDKVTGDRTLVWASKAVNDAEKVRADAITQIEKNRFNFSNADLCRASDDRTGLKPAQALETDGRYAYLFMVGNPSGTGAGLVRIPLTGGKCEWLSRYYQDGTSDVGSGATVNTLSPLLFSSALAGREFLGVTGPNPNGNVLFAINTDTGARRTISILNRNAARSVGKGDVEVGMMGRMAVTSTGYALTMYPGTRDRDFKPIAIQLSTGDRSVMGARAGVLKNAVDTEGVIVAALPDGVNFVVAFDKALHVWNSNTGNSYVLSR